MQKDDISLRQNTEWGLAYVFIINFLVCLFQRKVLTTVSPPVENPCCLLNAQKNHYFVNPVRRTKNLTGQVKSDAEG